MSQLNEQSRRAYLLWESEGRPNGRALDHWLRASVDEPDEEKVLECHSDANMPALLTKVCRAADVR